MALELSEGMLKIGRRKARPSGPADFVVGDAGVLPFPDSSFDTVVSSLCLCTFPDPVANLRDMARVCRRDGRLLLLEHGRSDHPRIAAWQDRKAEGHARAFACHWNREPHQLIREAGLELLSARRTFFGVFHLVEAALPAETPC